MTNLHEDFGPTLWVVNTIFIVLATLAVTARFAARRLRNLSFGADDWLICLALFWDWVLYGLFVGCRRNGLGKHRAVIPPQKVAVFSEILYFFQIFYVLGPATVKLSLLFLYRRIFEHSRFLRIVYGMIALISVWFAIGYAVVNIVTDFVVWLMPIPDMWKIQLPKAQKIALSLIFALGLFDCAAAMARLFLSMLVLGQYDSTWLYAPGYMWSIIKVSTGIACTCLPTMRVLLKVLFGSRMARVFGMSSWKASGHRSNNKPWTRDGTAGEAGVVNFSFSDHRAGDISDSPEWEASSQQVLVPEEMNIKLQRVK